MRVQPLSQQKSTSDKSLENERITSVRYTWQSPKNKFRGDERAAKELFSEPQIQQINEVVSEFEANSGIKQESALFSCSLFIFLTVSGFGVGLILITNGFVLYGGMAIVITAIVSFYSVVGVSMLAGTPDMRVEEYLRQNQLKMVMFLGRSEIFMVASFSRGKVL